MIAPRKGIAENLPYSLSRWTDLPAAKWPWFKQQLDQGWMVGFDPRTSFPDRWSLDPVDTLGMIFWTRNPSNLVLHERALRPYRKVIHFTLTGWAEVERRAPGIDEGLELLSNAVATFGVSNVTWRFSPVPCVADVALRFERIALRAAELGLRQVYLAFLQPNDRIDESRSIAQRRALLEELSSKTSLEIVLCNEDRSTLEQPIDQSVRNGICEDGGRFGTHIRSEGCGCALSVDPFTQNEACVYGCEFCYSANRESSPKKRNTTTLATLRRAKSS